MAKLQDTRVLAHGQTFEFTGRSFMGVPLVLNIQECHDDDSNVFFRAWFEEVGDRCVFGEFSTGYYEYWYEAVSAAEVARDRCDVDWEMQRIIKQHNDNLRTQGLLADYLQYGKG